MGKLKTIITVIVILYLAAFITSKIFSSSIKDDIISNGIAVIKIDGPIMIGNGNSFLGSGSSGSDEILNNLKRAEKSSGVKAIILEINSPGGTVVASKEIADKVKSIDKPTVAFIREVGASGAYWIASAADLIIADELSITGSIGVISSYLDFSGLLEDHNVTYQRLVTGEFKDAGTPFKELTQRERDMIQRKLDIIEARFILEIAANRDLPIDKVEQLADGSFYLGIEAKEAGLIDLTGNKDLAIEKAKEMANLTSENIVEYVKKPSLLNIFEKLTAESFYSIGKGLGDSVKQEEEFLILAK